MMRIRTSVVAWVGWSVGCWLMAPFVLHAQTPASGAAETPPAEPAAGVLQPHSRADVEGVELFQLESRLLSDFWGRPMSIEAGVVLPPDYESGDSPIPVCYSIHGFGGSHRSAWRSGPSLRAKMEAGDSPRMLYVFLNAQFPLGHHEFADSVNNGPWGRALTEEFIPALEKRYPPAAAVPAGRLLTGHSSGGWSSLWLQVIYPDFFGGTWSTAPDPVDFRHFTGVNIYDDENAFYDADGNERPLMRRGGQWTTSIKQFVDREMERSDYGGQFASFDAVFSPRGDDGRPLPLFDRTTGVIDPAVAEAWKKYDIGRILQDQWPTLGPKLRGKLRIYVGTEDTFQLEGAVQLLQEQLTLLESDAEVLLVEGRSHGSLFAPHPEFWPAGMLDRIHNEMWQQWQDAQTRPAAQPATSGNRRRPSICRRFRK